MKSTFSSNLRFQHFIFLTFLMAIIPVEMTFAKCPVKQETINIIAPLRIEIGKDIYQLNQQIYSTEEKINNLKNKNQLIKLLKRYQHENKKMRFLEKKRDLLVSTLDTQRASILNHMGEINDQLILESALKHNMTLDAYLTSLNSLSDVQSAYLKNIELCLNESDVLKFAIIFQTVIRAEKSRQAIQDKSKVVLANINSESTDSDLTEEQLAFENLMLESEKKYQELTVITNLFATTLKNKKFLNSF